MGTQKPIEVIVRKEPWFKLEFDTRGCHDEDIFVRMREIFAGMWKKFPFVIITAMIVILSTVVVIMTATTSKEEIIRVLTMVVNCIPSMEKIQIIPATIATIVACFITGAIFLRRCKCQWGEYFTIKFIFRPSSPSCLLEHRYERDRWIWKSGYYKNYSPQSDIAHRFIKLEAGCRDDPYSLYQLRAKFVTIDITTSVGVGLMLWIGWMHIIALCS